MKKEENNHETGNIDVLLVKTRLTIKREKSVLEQQIENNLPEDLRMKRANADLTGRILILFFWKNVPQTVYVA